MTDWSKKSLQHIFNHVARHLLKQNKKALNRDGGCVCFDKKSKLRCAIGSLLPIKSYNKFKGMYEVLVESGITNIYDTKCRLVNDMRYCHDIVEPSRWPSRLRAIAKKYNLNIPDFLKRS